MVAPTSLCLSVYSARRRRRRKKSISQVHYILSTILPPTTEFTCLFLTYLQFPLTVTATSQQLHLRTQRGKEKLTSPVTVSFQAKRQSSALLKSLILYFHVWDFSKMTDEDDSRYQWSGSVLAAEFMKIFTF